jgi:hypothetical protein
MSLPTNDVETKSRIYQDFSGVDFSNEEVKTYRSPDSVNMWKNYNNAQGKGIETRPGMIQLANFGLKINGIYFYDVQDVTQVIIHSGTKLYKWNNYPEKPTKSENLTELFDNMNIIESQMFVFNNVMFIKDGINYLEYNGITIKEVEGTVPTTTISKLPTGAGTTYQDINLLTPKRKNSFVADGESIKYQLDTNEIDSTSVVATVNGITMLENNGFTVDRQNGIITFSVAPTTPLTDGQDNVVIEFSKTISGNKEKITKCNMLTMFDNRIFYSGNQDYPNVLFYCELEDPRYVSDQNYYNEGDLTPIKAIVPGNNCLWVLKKQNQSNSSVFYHSPTIDYDYGKVYPKQQSNISTGCLSTGINFADDIVFLSNYGLEAISGDIQAERLLAHRSSNVDKKMVNETGYENAKIVEYKGYLLILINSKVYLADSRQRFQNISIEYEWYYWELPYNITFIKEKDNNLYLGNDNGELYILEGTTDDGKEIQSKWSTPSDAFGYEAYRKTTNKNGCVLNVMNKGATINVKTIADTKTEELGNFADSKEYIVLRIKRKKWKKLQLIFSSNKPFGLFLCTLEVFIGGYLKR